MLSVVQDMFQIFDIVVDIYLPKHNLFEDLNLFNRRRRIYNIIQIHKSVLGLTIFHIIFPNSNCMWKILCGILSVPHNVVMDMNNVMQEKPDQIISA